MLVAANITQQFGAKPLFENVSVKFGDGNRYGLIGANGAGKSTFMKILCGELEQSAGNVSKETDERMAYLRQDQFGYEDTRVLDVVMMGHAEMWACMSEKDAIYANPEASEEDYMRAAELEGVFAEYDGYTAEARAGELLLGVGIPTEQHDGPMSQVAPGWKLRVLLCQALFANPDILLLDEPTNNLDINTIRWLEDVLNQRDSTMVIISHDRHFLNQVCTHMADLDYGTITIYPGNYDDYMEASTMARERQSSTNTPVVLIGHITKDGHIAGPKILEHMVDTVLQFEGDRNHVYRILRAHKNRFGSTNELGIYEMQGEGLREVSNPAFTKCRAKGFGK